jgi:hypothetical protein
VQVLDDVLRLHTELLQAIHELGHLLQLLNGGRIHRRRRSPGIRVNGHQQGQHSGSEPGCAVPSSVPAIPCAHCLPLSSMGLVLQRGHQSFWVLFMRQACRMGV